MNMNLDNPGDVRWFDGYGPAPVLGHCLHGCARHRHHGIAYGPTYDRYTLVECAGSLPGVVAGCGCRAWLDSWGNEVTPWLMVDAAPTENTAQAATPHGREGSSCRPR